MKKALLISLVIACTASMAFAQGGTIGIYFDQLGANCFLPDNAPAVQIYWLVHTAHAGATAAQFWAPTPACMLAIYLSDLQVFPVTLGNSQSGVAVGFGGCFGTPNAVLGIQYFTQGLTGPCCLFPVLPDPNVPSGNIEIVDCVGTLLVANGGVGAINGNASCNCATIGTEETTWGQLKSIYAQ